MLSHLKMRSTRTALCATLLLASGQAVATVIDSFTDDQAYEASGNSTLNTKNLQPVSGSIFDTRELFVSPDLRPGLNTNIPQIGRSDETISISNGSASFTEGVRNEVVNYEIAYTTQNSVDLSGANQIRFEVFQGTPGPDGLPFEIVLEDQAQTDSQLFQVSNGVLSANLNAFSVDSSDLQGLSIKNTLSTNRVTIQHLPTRRPSTPE